MHFLRHKRRRAPSVIIVSLIDVLLVVLIFLMVTSTFKKTEPALKLALPESKIAKPGTAEPKPPFIIGVSTNFPFFFLEQKPVTYEQLRKELAGATQRDPQVRVQIKADKLAPWGEVIKVIDAAKLANVAAIDAITQASARP